MIQEAIVFALFLGVTGYYTYRIFFRKKDNNQNGCASGCDKCGE